MTPLTPRNLDDERLSRLIGATRAVADPAVLARARSRLAARPNAPRLALWLARPAVLAGAGALFALCVAGVLTLAQRPVTTGNATTLAAALLGEEDLGLPVTTATTAPTGSASGDSGEVSL